MTESRTKNSIKNLVVALLMQFLTVLVSFLCRTVFVKCISEEYLGLNGLFSNIISILSLSELGIGSAIIVNLYKPIANGDEIRIAKLMNFYRSIYTIIGLFIVVAGFAILPFLNFFIKTDTVIENVDVYFLFFIFQSASSYFFSYKQSFLTACQKEYICSFVRQAFIIIMNIFQIYVLLLTRDYLLYLTVSILTNLGTNIVISIIADKKYPFLERLKYEKIDSSDQKHMFKSAFSMAIHKIGNTLINSTDNIIISSVIGIAITGRYSNYVLIINIVAQLTTLVLNAVSAGIGNFVNTKTRLETKHFFFSLARMNIWVYGMCSICFCCLFQPTISIWIGNQYLLEYSVVVLISVNFFINGAMKPSSMFVDVTGLYLKTKWKPILMAIVNLIVSYIAAINFGLIGVFIGTFVCYLVGFWVDPFYLYKVYFNVSPLEYHFKVAIDTLVVIIIGLITYLTVSIISSYILKIAVSVIASNLLLFVYYFKTSEFSFFKQRIKCLIHKA